MVFVKRFFVEITSLEHIETELYIERFKALFPNTNVTVFEGVKHK